MLFRIRRGTEVWLITSDSDGNVGQWRHLLQEPMRLSRTWTQWFYTASSFGWTVSLKLTCRQLWSEWTLWLYVTAFHHSEVKTRIRTESEQRDGSSYAVWSAWDTTRNAGTGGALDRRNKTNINCFTRKKRKHGPESRDALTTLTLFTRILITRVRVCCFYKWDVSRDWNEERQNISVWELFIPGDEAQLQLVRQWTSDISQGRTATETKALRHVYSYSVAVKPTQTSWSSRAKLLHRRARSFTFTKVLKDDWIKKKSVSNHNQGQRQRPGAQIVKTRQRIKTRQRRILRKKKILKSFMYQIKMVKEKPKTCFIIIIIIIYWWTPTLA